jgi:protoporphyrinogen oxidase
MPKTFKRNKFSKKTRKNFKKTYRRKNRGGMLSKLATTAARRSSPQIEKKMKDKMQEYTGDLMEASIKTTPQYKQAKEYTDKNISNILYKNISENKENVPNVPNYMYTSTTGENRAKMLSENVQLSPLIFKPYQKEI